MRLICICKVYQLINIKHVRKPRQKPSDANIKVLRSNFVLIVSIKSIWCGRCDSNARTPTRIGSEPIAFDLAGQLPHIDFVLFLCVNLLL